MLALQPPPRIVAQQAERLALEPQAVVRKAAGQQFDRPPVETVGLPRDVELPVVLQHEGVDGLGAQRDDRTVVRVGAFGTVGRGHADIRRAVALAAGRIIGVGPPVVVEQLRGPERRAGPLGLLFEQVARLRPVHQVARSEERIERRPLRRGSAGIVGLADADDAGIGQVARNHRIGKGSRLGGGAQTAARGSECEQ